MHSSSRDMMDVSRTVCTFIDRNHLKVSELIHRLDGNQKD